MGEVLAENVSGAEIDNTQAGKIRNPKLETRNKFKERKIRILKRDADARSIQGSSCGFPHVSSFGFVSDFGIWNSDFFPGLFSPCISRGAGFACPLEQLWVQIHNRKSTCFKALSIS